MRKRLSPHQREQRGAALLEFALVIPIFVFVLYALIAFGMQLATKQQVTNAASEGARAAVGASSDTLAQSQATARVTSVLGTPNGRYTISYPSPSCTGCIDVKVTYHYDTHPIVPAGMGIGYKPFSSTAVVQYK